MRRAVALGAAFAVLLAVSLVVGSAGARTDAATATTAVDTTLVPPSAGQLPEEQVSYCHRTTSVIVPYVLLTTDADAIIQRGHGSHTGPVFPEVGPGQNGKWGDIIPPFDYDNGQGHFPGLNWPGGGDVLRAGCAVHETIEPPPGGTTTTTSEPTATTGPASSTASPSTATSTTTPETVTTTSTPPVSTTTPGQTSTTRPLTGGGTRQLSAVCDNHHRRHHAGNTTTTALPTTERRRRRLRPPLDAARRALPRTGAVRPAPPILVRHRSRQPVGRPRTRGAASSNSHRELARRSWLTPGCRRELLAVAAHLLSGAALVSLGRASTTTNVMASTPRREFAVSAGGRSRRRRESADPDLELW